MSEPDRSAPQAPRDTLREDLRWALDRYHDLNGAYPLVRKDLVYEHWRRGLTSYWVPRLDSWIMDPPEWSSLIHQGSAIELLRARDEVWRVYRELCARLGAPVPTPSWDHQAALLAELPPYLRDRPPPPWTAAELEEHYRVVFRELLAGGKAGGEILLADVAVALGKDSTTLSRWQSQLGLGRYRALRDRLLLGL